MIESLPEHRRTRVQTTTDVLRQLDDRMRSGEESDVRTVPTGFDVLDDILGGGLHAGELLLLGGPPGVGKTIAALQWARQLAQEGHTAIFACYEHEPTTLLVRLLGLEVGELGGDERFAQGIVRLLAEGDATGRGIDEVLTEHPIGQQALERIRSYADRLIMVRASGAHTTLDQLGEMMREHRVRGTTTVLFVDYLQKIPMQPEPSTEAEKVTRTVEGLKDLALEHHTPVVLLSAVDAEGMRASRLRLFHLRGSSAIAFESDVVVMMNSKEKAISKVHLTYDAVRARSFRNYVVFSVEKNRGGPNLIDLEYGKDFAHFRFNPEGGVVSEKLVDERLDEAEL
jgi:replicative DNA helicase